MDMIRVVNRHGETLYGRYDGKDYTFPSKKPVDIPKVAAAHIFGLGVEDKTSALNRLGFLYPHIKYEDALKKLEKIQFLQGEVVFEEPLDLEEPTENGRARVNLGGDAGAVAQVAAPSEPRRVPAPRP